STGNRKAALAPSAKPGFVTPVRLNTCAAVVSSSLITWLFVSQTRICSGRLGQQHAARGRKNLAPCHGPTAFPCPAPQYVLRRVCGGSPSQVALTECMHSLELPESIIKHRSAGL